MISPGPNPAANYGPTVEVDGMTLRCQTATYEVVEAPRFGQKINIGALKYADFNPYDSAHAIASLAGGYGLQAYADLPDGDAAATMCDTTTNVDTRNTPITLSPLIGASGNLTGADGPPVWAGMFLGKFVVVAGTKVYYRNADSPGGWHDTAIALPYAALQAAVGVFNGKLTFGFGASGTAKYTSDLINLSNVVDGVGSIYVWAFTADHAASYVAGGPSATASRVKVISSAGGSTYDSTTAINCGTVDYPITSLAPGGGLTLLYVGKDTELGSIDTNGVYHCQIPYDSQLSTNTSVLKWQLSRGADEQRGPLSLVFNREHSLWAYQPSSQDAGQAANISPWASPYLHMDEARGRITAIQGSARWLYIAFTNSDGNSWIAVRDARTGSWHLVWSLGTHTCQLLAIGTPASVAKVPMLLIGYGNDLVEVTLPFDGDAPDDNQKFFQATGSLYLSDIELGFPDEDKIPFTVRINHRNLSEGAQELAVYASFDGGSYALLGTCTEGEFTDMDFDPDSACKRVKLRIDFSTNTSTLSPELHGITVSMSLNTSLRRLWNFLTLIPGGYRRHGQDLANPHTTIAALWTARADGLPVSFRDRWGDRYNVRILALDEKEIINPSTGTPETAMKITLLEVGPGADTPITWSSSPSYSSLLPITFS